MVYLRLGNFIITPSESFSNYPGAFGAVQIVDYYSSGGGVLSIFLRLQVHHGQGSMSVGPSSADFWLFNMTVGNPGILGWGGNR